MATISEEEGRELFAVMNPYQVAVLAFTSPAEVSDRDRPGRLILTSKASYVWAAAVAHVLTYRPAFGEEQVLEYLNLALKRFGKEYVKHASNPALDSIDYVASGFQLVQEFLYSAGFDGDDLREACTLTQDAIRCLEWLDIIEDPFRKKVLGAVLSVYALAGPIGFTSQGPNWTYSSPTFTVAAKDAGKETRYEFNLKIHRVAEAVKKAVVEIIEEVEPVVEDTGSEEAMTTEELQGRLRELGFYDGAVDGKAGTNTYKALRHFQQDRHLRITGYPDPETLRALRQSKRW